MRSATRVTRRILGFQAVGTVVAAVAALAVSGWQAAGGAAAGGAIGLAGVVVFSRRHFQAAPGSSARRMVTAFYWGAAAKMATTIALFAVAMFALRLPVPALIGGYVAALVAYWIALLEKTD